MESPSELLTFLPGSVTAVAGLLVMMMAAFGASMRTVFVTSLVALAAAFAFAVNDIGMPPGTSFTGMVLYGGLASFGTALIVLASFFSVLFTRDFLEGTAFHTGEVYAMLLFATTGMISLATANNLVLLFVGLETMSVSLYVLAGLFRHTKEGAEAGLKYFLLGAFSTGFLLYGIALLYGATGTLWLDEIAEAASATPLFLAGAALLLVGLLFKVSAVPFHMWTPDVYQGTPTTLTGYMSTASKTASFLALCLVVMRLFAGATSLDTLGDLAAGMIAESRGGKALSVMAVLTMVVGNLVALTQDNVKRMLAYSSIAHAGYLMVGIVAGSQAGFSGVVYYLFAYTVMNLGAFGVIAYFERQEGLDYTRVENFAGLGTRSPMMAVLLSLFLFSLAGIPPFVGFLGKYYVFAAAVESGLITLAIIGVLASATSVYYYLRVMVFMYFREAHVTPELRAPGWTYSVGLSVLALLTLYYGIEPLLPVDSLFALLSGF